MTDATTAPVALGGARARPLADADVWPVSGPEELAALREVLESGRWAYDGPMEQRFERAFAAFQTAPHGLCVANGTVAVQLALEALDIGVGDEVIVPGLTWQATAAAVPDVNAVPILADVEPETYCIDPDAVERALSPRTKAIVVVHLFNSLADLDRILAIGRNAGVHVIEDCAHSHGSLWRGRGVGSIGDIGCFSFQSTKSLSAGEGGFCTTSSELLHDRLYSLRNCGRRRPDSSDATTWAPVQSGNYRTTEWQAAVLLCQLARLEEQVVRRERNALALDEALRQIPGVEPMLRREAVTRQGMYAYVFRYAAEAFGGLSASGFRSALSTELGVNVRSTYEPLNQSPLFRPHTKRRHRLNEDYWRSIDPSRFELPVADRAYADESMVIAHEILLADAVVDAVPEAVERLSRHCEALAVHEGTR